MTGCYDCGRQYGDANGFPDLVIPSEIWREISPKKNDGGLLCPSCICQRLHAAGYGWAQVKAAFLSGPIRTVSPEHMTELRSAENLREQLAAQEDQ